MTNDQICIRKSRILLQEHLRWDDYNTWTQYNYIKLSDMIRDKTGITISEITLMRFFGKVNTKKETYTPQRTTREAIAQFMDHKDWESLRNYILDNFEVKKTATLVKVNMRKPLLIAAIVLITLCSGVYVYFFQKFETTGIALTGNSLTTEYISGKAPQTLRFNYDLNPKLRDSVFIHYGNKNYRNKPYSDYLPPDNNTIVHYYPFHGVYTAELKVNNTVLDHVRFVVESDHWNGNISGTKGKHSIYHEAAPYNYHKGILRIPDYLYDSLRTDTLVYYQTNYSFYKDFGVDGDHMTFEGRFFNDIVEYDKAYCNFLKLYLICEYNQISLNVTEKKCYASAHLLLEKNEPLTGKYHDLSKLTADMSDYFEISLDVMDHSVNIYINNEKRFLTGYTNDLGPLLGIIILMNTSGAVDYIHIMDNSMGKMVYKEEF